MAYTITEACSGCGACQRVCPAYAIRGEKKAAHEIIAGLCIECGACGRVCPREAVLDQDGRPCRMVKRSEWKRPSVCLKACVACGMCTDACPVGCLVMSETPREGGGDPYLSLENEKACLGCGLCAGECPVGALTLV